jgi:hypothetical protein
MADTEPIGYDVDGLPLYASEPIDTRWKVLLKRFQRAEGNHAMNQLEGGMIALVYCQDVDLAREGLEMIGALCERQVQRRADPYLLDTESGRQHYRNAVVADLREKGDTYARVSARLGWPDDPADLSERDLGLAIMVVLHPEMLREVELNAEGWWDRFGDQ